MKKRKSHSWRLSRKPRRIKIIRSTIGLYDCPACHVYMTYIDPQVHRCDVCKGVFIGGELLTTNQATTKL